MAPNLKKITKTDEGSGEIFHWNFVFWGSSERDDVGEN
jgi:hypothetical protein